MRISVYPRSWFSKFNDDELASLFENSNVISINTPEFGEEKAEVPPFPEQYWNNDNVLIIYFPDSDTTSGIGDENLFNDIHAAKIAAFVSKTKDNGKQYIIHCTAGASRSQAVGYVLNEWLNGPHGLNMSEHDYSEYVRQYGRITTMNVHVKHVLMSMFFGPMV